MSGTPAPSSVLIVGTGLIGTSIGLALRRHGVRVYLEDRDPGQASMAAELGAGEPGRPAEGVELAIVAVPPEAVGQVVCDLLDGGVAAFATDVASVKLLPETQIRAACRNWTRFVGSHPMAGREVSGPVAARIDLFAGRTWVVCPDPQTDATALRLVMSVAELAGAVPVTMPAADHDAAVALVSHAPHVVASAMAARLADAAEAQVRLAGQGIADVTRVAAGDPGLWAQILAANAQAVRPVLEAIRADLDRLVHALADKGRSGDVTAVLDAGVKGQARLPGKHGAPHVDYATVVVILEDRPGQLARLFTDVDSIDANIEDVRIEHAAGRPLGFVQLAVRLGAESALAAALQERGWSVLGSR